MKKTIKAYIVFRNGKPHQPVMSNSLAIYPVPTIVKLDMENGFKEYPCTITYSLPNKKK